MEKKNIVSSFLVLSLIASGVGGASLINRAAADDTEIERPAKNPEMFIKKINKTVEKIENGVIITLTTDDATELERLQTMTEMPMHGPGGGFMDEVDQAVNVLDNGVQITLTSEDAEMVEKLQNLPDEGGFGPGHGGHGPKLPFFSEDVTRSVEEIENGVVVTLTAEDTELVEKLQNFQWEPIPMEEQEMELED